MQHIKTRLGRGDLGIARWGYLHAMTGDKTAILSYDTDAVTFSIFLKLFLEPEASPYPLEVWQYTKRKMTEQEIDKINGDSGVESCLKEGVIVERIGKSSSRAKYVSLMNVISIERLIENLKLHINGTYNDVLKLIIMYLSIGTDFTRRIEGIGYLKLVRVILDGWRNFQNILTVLPVSDVENAPSSLAEYDGIINDGWYREWIKLNNLEAMPFINRTVLENFICYQFSQLVELNRRYAKNKIGVSYTYTSDDINNWISNTGYKLKPFTELYISTRALNLTFVLHYLLSTISSPMLNSPPFTLYGWQSTSSEPNPPRNTIRFLDQLDEEQSQVSRKRISDQDTDRKKKRPRKNSRKK